MWPTPIHIENKFSKEHILTSRHVEYTYIYIQILIFFFFSYSALYRRHSDQARHMYIDFSLFFLTWRHVVAVTETYHVPLS
jgi:hypothetical protein